MPRVVPHTETMQDEALQRSREKEGLGAIPSNLIPREIARGPVLRPPRNRMRERIVAAMSTGSHCSIEQVL